MQKSGFHENVSYNSFALSPRIVNKIEVTFTLAWHDSKSVRLICFSFLNQNVSCDGYPTFINFKLPFVFITFILSIFEWRLKTSFTVHGCYLNSSDPTYLVLKV